MDKPVNKIIKTIQEYCLLTYSDIISGNYKLSSDDQRLFIGCLLIIIGIIGLLFT